MTLSPTQMQELTRRWQQLFIDLPGQAADDCVNKIFGQIVACYSEPQRHYHTLQHIQACLGWLDKVEAELDNPLTVQLALWLHDVIYFPKKSDNEKQSAVYARTALAELDVRQETIAQVEHLILLTQHPSSPQTPDENVLIDIDLSILGANTSDYDSYSDAIRQEYRHVPDFLYRRGRKKLLKQFLQQERIYSSGYFSSRLEQPARENLRREIDTL